jgi:hypothetical protein
MITICFNLEGVLKKTQQSRLDGLEMTPHRIVTQQQKYSEIKEIQCMRNRFNCDRIKPPTAKYSETVQTRAFNQLDSANQNTARNPYGTVGLPNLAR